MSSPRTIRLVEDEEGWTAIDEEAGVECTGDDRAAVLERLDDAVAISFDDTDADADEDDVDSDIEWFED